MRKPERYIGAILDATTATTEGFEAVLTDDAPDWPGAPDDVDEIAAWRERIARAWLLVEDVTSNLRELGAELARVANGALDPAPTSIVVRQEIVPAIVKMLGADRALYTELVAEIPEGKAPDVDEMIAVDSLATIGTLIESAQVGRPIALDALMNGVPDAVCSVGDYLIGAVEGWPWHRDCGDCAEIRDIFTLGAEIEAIKERV